MQVIGVLWRGLMGFCLVRWSAPSPPGPPGAAVGTGKLGSTEAECLREFGTTSVQPPAIAGEALTGVLSLWSIGELLGWPLYMSSSEGARETALSAVEGVSWCLGGCSVHSC